jgi:hypothetical protein
MTLMGDPSLSTTERAGLFTVVASQCDPSDESRARSGVSVVLPDPSAGPGLASALERMPDVVDELILVRGCASRIADGAVQRAGFAAAHNDCIVMAGRDADLSAIGHFVHALCSGCAAVIGARAPLAG